MSTQKLALALLFGMVLPASAALVVSGNVKYEDFQGMPGTVNGSSPTPVNGTGATSPLDPTWDYTTDAFSAVHITNPSNTDYLQVSASTLSLVYGALHSISLPVSALADGLLPRNNDDPGNPGGRVVFGNSGTYRVQIAFPANRLVSELNSYSWHGSTRTMQVYDLLGSSAAVAPLANGATVANLQAAGWSLITHVDSNVLDTENVAPGAGTYDENSKHGVSINLGLTEYRYLLMNFNAGFGSDAFMGEVDVYTLPVPEPASLAMVGVALLCVLRRRRA